MSLTIAEIVSEIVTLPGELIIGLVQDGLGLISFNQASRAVLELKTALAFWLVMLVVGAQCYLFIMTRRHRAALRSSPRKKGARHELRRSHR